MKKYALGLYEKSMPSKLSWGEKLLAARQAGFDFLEMSIDETDAKLTRLDMSEDERTEIRAAMRSTGIPIRSICLSAHRKYSLGNPDPEKQVKSLEIMQKAVCLAADLGVRVIQLAGYDVYYEESTEKTRNDFGENLKKCVEMAAREGIIMGFETMETPFMDNVKKAMKYVHKVQSPYLGVYLDSGNITNAALSYGDDVADDIRRGAGHLIAVHLKESKPEKYREIPFGSGHVDFEKIIRTSWELGVRRYVAEFWYTGQLDWSAELSKTNSFIHEYFSRIEGTTGAKFVS